MGELNDKCINNVTSLLTGWSLIKRKEKGRRKRLLTRGNELGVVEGEEGGGGGEWVTGTEGGT